MIEPTLPPVGATVTDADGETWDFVGDLAGRSWQQFDSSVGWRVAGSNEVAPLCTALWRMRQERNELQARVAAPKERAEKAEARVVELEETLVGIRDANWRHWAGTEGSMADDFVVWAKSRARHVLGNVTP